MPHGALSLQEVKEKYRTPRDKDAKSSWWAKNTYIRLAVPIGAFLLRTGISANQVTVLWIVVGMAGCLLLAIPSRIVTLFACLCLFMHMVLDFTDGIVARGRQHVSSTGIFLDRIGHDLIFPCSMFALAFRGTRIFPPVFILTTGFLAAISFFLYNNNRRSKVLSYLFLQKQLKYHMFLELVNHRKEGETQKGQFSAEAQQSSLFVKLKGIFRRVHWVWTPEKYWIIIYVSALLNQLEWLPIFYAVTTVPLFIVSVYHQVCCGDRWVESYLVEPQTATDWGH